MRKKEAGCSPAKGLFTAVAAVLGAGCAIPAAAVVPTTAAADAGEPSAAARKAIEAAYARYDSAWLKKDARALLAYSRSFLAPDFMQKLPDGTLTSGTKVLQDLEAVAKLPAMPGIRVVKEQKTTLGKLIVNAVGGSARRATAVALTTDTGAMVRTDFEGRYGPVGQEHEIRVTLLNRDTWVRAASGWKLKTNEVLNATMMVDGKPFRGDTVPAAAPPPAPPKTSATPPPARAAAAAAVPSVSLTMSAWQLYGAYARNASEADRLYKGRQILVRGIIRQTGTEPGGGSTAAATYVTLETDDRTAVVKCLLPDRDRAALGRVKKGQTIWVTGICAGKVGKDVLLRALPSPSPPR